MFPMLFSLIFLPLLHFQQVVGSPMPTNGSCSLDSYTLISNNGTGIWPYRTYKSTNITSPTFNITQYGASLSPGLIFMGLENGAFNPGEHSPRPLIMTDTGDLVWAGPNISASSNVRGQTLYGQPAMSYWRGSGEAGGSGETGHGYGQVDILDSSYNTTYTICPKVSITLPPGTSASCIADVHESYITSNNTMIVTVYNLTTADLTSVGGPKDGWVRDPLAVEVDIKTNEPIWMWSPLAHVPINTTHSKLMSGQGSNSSDPFDWFHTNSIQSFEGNYLINSRNTWTSYYVNRNGSIEWTINGVDGGDFGSLPKDGQFSWQHHARLHSTSTPSQKLLTYFADNNGDLSTQNASIALGLLLTLPPSPSTPPTLFSSLNDPTDKIVAYAEGSYELLTSNGSSAASSNAFVGYGARPVMKEFGPGSNGEVLWSAAFGYNNNNNSAQSYRTFKQEWHATPATPLDLVVLRADAADALSSCAAGSEIRGFVSWNGATEVSSYAIYTGSSGAEMQKVATVDRKGFETEFVVPSGAEMVQVKAIEGGRECGQSATVNVA